jgi:type VI secretion system secreted protein Hcp
MAVNAYLTLKGQRQGPISGPVREKGREHSIEIHSFSNQIVSLRDPASGLATGKRIHHPICIVKGIDQTSTALRTAFVANENLTCWMLQFWTVGAVDPVMDIEAYTIRLTNASIASIREFMADTEDPANNGLSLREEITFTYQKIEWLWTDGQTTAEDGWEQPVAG